MKGVGCEGFFIKSFFITTPIELEAARLRWKKAIGIRIGIFKKLN
jgi:hypothetical protein